MPIYLACISQKVDMRCWNSGCSSTPMVRQIAHTLFLTNGTVPWVFFMFSKKMN